MKFKLLFNNEKKHFITESKLPLHHLKQKDLINTKIDHKNFDNLDNNGKYQVVRSLQNHIGILNAKISDLKSSNEFYKKEYEKQLILKLDLENCKRKLKKLNSSNTQT